MSRKQSKNVTDRINFESFQTLGCPYKNHTNLFFTFTKTEQLFKLFSISSKTDKISQVVQKKLPPGKCLPNLRSGLPCSKWNFLLDVTQLDWIPASKNSSNPLPRIIVNGETTSNGVPRIYTIEKDGRTLKEDEDIDTTKRNNYQGWSLLPISYWERYIKVIRVSKRYKIHKSIFWSLEAILWVFEMR